MKITLIFIGLLGVGFAQPPEEGPPAPPTFAELDSDGDGAIISSELTDCSNACPTKCLCNALKKLAGSGSIAEDEFDEYLESIKPPSGPGGGPPKGGPPQGVPPDGDAPPEGAPEGGPPPPPMAKKLIIDCIDGSDDSSTDNKLSKDELQACKSWNCPGISNKICTGLHESIGKN